MDIPLDFELVALAHDVGERLLAAKLTFAAAESCTGGLIGHLITENAGCSSYFMGSAVVYSYDAKERVLGVDHATLVAEGAVSEAVACQMARGARRLFDVDMAVAVTGIAGPGGGLPNKPVGTVHIAVVGPWGEAAEHHLWDADRVGNKVRSALAALELLARELQR